MNKLALGVGLVLGVISLTCLFQLSLARSRRGAVLTDKQFMERDIGAIIHMSVEFMKDMDMKMRDVRRVEGKYLSTNDFGAGKIFAAIEQTFKHMVTLYKNTSRISKIMESDLLDASVLRKEIAGSLQFMLSDYMEMLSKIDLYRARFDYWQQFNADWRVRQTVMDYLIPEHRVYPYRYDPNAEEIG